MKYLSGQMIWSILGILCIIYGLFVSRTGSGTGFFLVWIALGIVDFLLALACRIQFWGRLPAGVRTAVLILLMILLVIFAAVQGRILSRFQSRGEPGLDYVIVLGAQVYDYGPSKVLRSRLDTAAEYLKENDKTCCIVSGGQGYNEPAPESDVMKQYLTEQGIDPSRITTERVSKNTVENIQYCLKLQDSGGAVKLIDPEQDTVGIVTNNFHVYRGRALARHAGIRHVCGIAAPSNKLYLPNNLLREFFGVAKDVLAGNMQL